MVTLAVLLILQLSVSLIYLTESEPTPCRAVISQPDEVATLTSAQDTTLPCLITQPCLSKVRWFVFRHKSHQEIRAQPLKYSPSSRALTIHSPQANDSGVYYCSSVPLDSSRKGAPSIGNGTRLVVRESSNTTIKTALLWTLLVVLTLYSLLILTLLILKARREIFRRKRRNTLDKSGSTRKLHFRAVVQELYGKRNLRSTEHTTRTYSHNSKVEHPHAYAPDEDVYQNI
ncbi:hypothetical protein SKAU_G00291200 [Synaphobranchus kaupii]|uniref:Ig-like domain-containing protein n=1 Tax=Synaphobranchus kaupii TaxID=118154 RepID=A0A9Q1ETT2_SYNKA|nr:hypothetical protein SKAU_G00291200 [Synaphobranchus kaupii]